MSTDVTPPLPPPPTPDQSATAVPSVQRTTGEKVTEAIGSRATAFGQGLSGLSGSKIHDFGESSVGKMLQSHYDSRLAEARVNYNSAQQLLGVLNSNVDPDTGQSLTPEKRAKYMQDAQAAWGAYAKSAGVNKEAKAAVGQKGQLFQLALTHGIEAAHQIASKLGFGGPGQGQGGQSQSQSQSQSKGAPPPPSPSSSSSSSQGPQASGGGSTPAAAGSPNPAVPPPPAPPSTSPQQVAMEVPRLQAEIADRHALAVKQAETDITTKGKIKEAEAKPSPTKTTPASDAYFSLLDQVDPKTGLKYTPQDALKIVTQASAKAGKPTPYEEWMANPQNYDKFQKEMAQAKQTQGKNASIGAVYGIYRMLEMGYKQNPDILPMVAAIAPQVFANAGMKVPPGMAEALGKVPLDQPLSPTTGAPIGTSMPSAPTGQTRNSAQTATRALPIIGELRQQIDDLKGYLGPIEGRKNVAFLLGKVGSTGDADKDQKLSQLRSNMELLATLTAKFHINSVRAMSKIEELANAGKDSGPAIAGYLDEVEKRAKEAQEQEKGAGEKGVTPPPGSTQKFTDGGKKYSIPAAMVGEFKKDHPNATAATR